MTVMQDKQEGIRRFAQESPCVCFNIRKASRIITQVYEKMFKDVGLTAPQAVILSSIRFIGSLTVSELSEAVSTDRTTITRNLKPLERDGYITIAPGQDRREREVQITQKGIDAAVQIGEKYQKFQEKLYEAVGEEKVSSLCRDLSATMDKIQQF